jgi:hypothetical protein
MLNSSRVLHLRCRRSLRNCLISLWLHLIEVEVNLRPTVSRPVCLGVRRPSGTHDQFFFLLEISFRQLRVHYFVAPSLTRGRVCNLLHNCFWALQEQSLLGWSPAELTAIFYCLIWDSPNLRARSRIYIPQEFYFCRSPSELRVVCLTHLSELGHTFKWKFSLLLLLLLLLLLFKLRVLSRWPRGTLYPQQLALTSMTRGVCSVSIVRSRTQATEFSF